MGRRCCGGLERPEESLIQAHIPMTTKLDYVAIATGLRNGHADYLKAIKTGTLSPPFAPPQHSLTHSLTRPSAALTSDYNLYAHPLLQQ